MALSKARLIASCSPSLILGIRATAAGLTQKRIIKNTPYSPISATVAEIGEYGVFFIIRFWVKPAAVARMPKIKEGLQEAIKRAFDKANISTPYPHMRLLMPKDVDYPIPTKPFATTTQILSNNELATDKSITDHLATPALDKGNR